MDPQRRLPQPGRPHAGPSPPSAACGGHIHCARPSAANRLQPVTKLTSTLHCQPGKHSGWKRAPRLPRLELCVVCLVFSKSASQGHGKGTLWAVPVCAHMRVRVRVYEKVPACVTCATLCTQHSFHCPLTPLCTRVGTCTHAHTYKGPGRAGCGVRALRAAGLVRFGFGAYHCHFLLVYPETPPPRTCGPL